MTVPHAEFMDAVAYWREFEAAVYFNEPGDELLGVVEHLGYADDAVTKAKLPKLLIKTDDGILRTLIAYQAHLRAELLNTRPAKGERIFIRYLGEDKRSAPGMSPTKRFKVKVDRSGSAPGPGTEPAVRGSAAGPENGPRGGSKATA